MISVTYFKEEVKIIEESPNCFVEATPTVLATTVDRHAGFKFSSNLRFLSRTLLSVELMTRFFWHLIKNEYGCHDDDHSTDDNQKNFPDR